MDDKYIEEVVCNFIEWLIDKSNIEKQDISRLAIIRAAWIEATRQADERNKNK